VEYREADSFVKQLIKYIVDGENVLNYYLPKEKIEFVFKDMPSLTYEILMRSIPKIKRMNKNGVLKMHKNIGSLHQKIFNIVPFTDSEFNLERVRKYYNLVNLGSKERVLSEATSSTSLDDRSSFTYEEYVRIIEFITNQTIDLETARQLKSILKA